MPVKGLPKTLENILEALFLDNTVISWQIFSEKNGNGVMKIRFSEAERDMGVEQVQRSYKRKSPAQVNRDWNRAKAFKNKPLESAHKNDAPWPVTRSMSKSDHIETFRVDTSSAHTPIWSVSPVTMDKTVVTPSSDVLAATDVGTPMRDECTHDELFSPMHSDQSSDEHNGSLVSPGMCLLSRSSSMESVSTGCETDREDMVPGTGTNCNHPSCAYGGGPCGGTDGTNAQYYKCSKCCSPKAGGTLFICHMCVMIGVHKRHKKYISLVSDD